jgi:nitrite reductase/ring-hydroxylating ferredoxin subunit
MIPVSLSGGVEPGARTGTSAGGRPVVVWRGQDGAARAWADQCPHRGMRLSFGFVRDNTLSCSYHGWVFVSGGADGSAPAAARCLAVPAHPSLPPPAKATVPALPVSEALGMIWVGTGPGDATPPPAAADASRDVHPVRSVTAPVPAAELRAALEAAPPPGTDSAEVTQAGDIITFKGRAALVIAAIQDRGDGTATAHVVTTDPGTEARKALCRWVALVRDHLAAVVLP